MSLGGKEFGSWEFRKLAVLEIEFLKLVVLRVRKVWEFGNYGSNFFINSVCGYMHTKIGVACLEDF